MGEEEDEDEEAAAPGAAELPAALGPSSVAVFKLSMNLARGVADGGLADAAAAIGKSLGVSSSP